MLLPKREETASPDVDAALDPELVVVSPSKALRSVSDMLAASRARVLELEAAVARGMRERADQDCAMSVLTTQVKYLTSRVAASSSSSSKPTRLPPSFSSPAISSPPPPSSTAVKSRCHNFLGASMMLKQLQGSFIVPGLLRSCFSSWRLAALEEKRGGSRQSLLSQTSLDSMRRRMSSKSQAQASLDSKRRSSERLSQVSLDSLHDFGAAQEQRRSRLFIDSKRRSMGRLPQASLDSLYGFETAPEQRREQLSVTQVDELSRCADPLTMASGDRVTYPMHPSDYPTTISIAEPCVTNSSNDATDQPSHYVEPSTTGGGEHDRDRAQSPDFGGDHDDEFEVEVLHKIVDELSLSLTPSGGDGISDNSKALGVAVDFLHHGIERLSEIAREGEHEFVVTAKALQKSTRIRFASCFMHALNAVHIVPASLKVMLMSWKAVIAFRHDKEKNFFLRGTQAMLKMLMTKQEQLVKLRCFSSWFSRCIHSRYKDSPNRYNGAPPVLEGTIQPAVPPVTTLPLHEVRFLESEDRPLLHGDLHPQLAEDIEMLKAGQKRVEEHIVNLVGKQSKMGSPLRRSASPDYSFDTQEFKQETRAAPPKFGDDPRSDFASEDIQPATAYTRQISPSVGQMLFQGSSNANPDEIEDVDTACPKQKSRKWRAEHNENSKQEIMGYLDEEWSMVKNVLKTANLHEDTPSGAPDTAVARFVESSCFNAITGMAILANTICIGIESDAAVKLALDNLQEGKSETMPSVYDFITNIFTVYFAIELCLKLYGLRLWFFIGDGAGWNMFDAVLVLTSILQILLQGMNLNFMRIFRVFRMIRALRILRTLQFFRELRRMTLAIVSCMVSLSWAFLLLLLITYVFSIMFMQAASGYVEEADEDDANLSSLAELYGSMTKSMYSMLQAISGGNDWAGIAEPLQPISVIYTLTFVVYVLFVTFGVLNVLTGVFLESASEIMDRDLMAQAAISCKKRFANNLRQLFKELDTDGSGYLTWDEFCDALLDDNVQAFFEAHDLSVLDAHALFHFTAGDGDEAEVVSEDDFIFGCQRYKGEARCMHIAELQQENTRRFEKLDSSLKSLDDHVVQVQESIAGILKGDKSLPAVLQPKSERVDTGDTRGDVADFGEKAVTSCEGEICGSLDFIEKDMAAARVLEIPAKDVQPLDDTGENIGEYSTASFLYQSRSKQWSDMLSHHFRKHTEPSLEAEKSTLCGITFPAESPATSSARFVNSPFFSMAMGGVIFLNTMMIGIEADASMKAQLASPPEKVSGVFAIMGHTFTIIYCVELTLKLYALRLWFFCSEESGWNCFDLLLVFTSLLQVVLSFGSFNTKNLRILRVFRMIRALRILRVLRFFRELRRMTLAIVSCLTSLSWAFLLLILMIYVFSIVFVQAASAHIEEEGQNDSNADLIDMYGSLVQTMYTMIQAISGGNDWANLAKPLEMISPIYVIVFMLYVLFVTFGVLNVLTGVFLESAGEIMDRDLVAQAEFARRETFCQEMHSMFDHIDRNHTGTISWDKFHDALSDETVKSFFTCQQLEAIDAHVLFTLIAQDRVEIDISEFIMGCWRMAGNARTMHFTMVQQDFSSWRRAVDLRVKALREQLDKILQQLSNQPDAPRRRSNSGEKSMRSFTNSFSLGDVLCHGDEYDNLKETDH